MGKLRQLTDLIIKKSFPELLGEDVQVRFEELKDALMEVREFSSEGYLILVDKPLKKASEKVLTGGLAHELSHIIFFKRIPQRIPKKFRVIEERNIDLEVLVRGYGKELLGFMKYAEKMGNEYYKENGLSIREIKVILKKY